MITNNNTLLIIDVNKNTYKCKIKSNKDIYFNKENSIRSLLEFSINLKPMADTFQMLVLIYH